jgi:hypothetical protein
MISWEKMAFSRKDICLSEEEFMKPLLKIRNGIGSVRNMLMNLKL